MRLVDIIVACACALAGVAGQPAHPPWLNHVEAVGNVPDYVGSLKLMNESAEMLRKFLPHETLQVTDPRRHYIIIAGVLGCVVEYLNSDCSPPDYEHQFLPAVDRLLPIIWQHPDVAVAKLETFINDANITVQPIKNLKDQFCLGTTQEACNKIIKLLSLSRKDYEYALDLLESLAQLAKTFQENPYHREAERFDEVALLLRGKEKLKPLVYQAANVYYKLYGKRCFLKKR